MSFFKKKKIRFLAETDHLCALRPSIGIRCVMLTKRRVCLGFKKKSPERANACRGSRLERMTGIGPAYSAWEADILPLNYIRRSPTRCGKNKNSDERSFYGANDGTRTHDLLITNQLLYHLSHISIVRHILSQSL